MTDDQLWRWLSGGDLASFEPVEDEAERWDWYDWAFALVTGGGCVAYVGVVTYWCHRWWFR